MENLWEIIGLFFTAPGPGGLVVIFIIGLAATIYIGLTRWIIQGGQKPDDFDRFQ